MITKLLLLSGILPVVGSIVARKFFCDRALARHGSANLSLNGRQFAEAIFKKARVEGIEIEEKRRPFLALSAEKLFLSPALAGSRAAKDVAAAGLLAGLVLMARRQAKVVGWRAWAVKFGWAMPAFSIVIMVFAIAATSLTPFMGIGVICAILGVASLALWLTLPVEREAANTVAAYLEESALVPRRSESDLLASLVRALAWQRLVPGCIEWLIPKPKPRPSDPL